jgi:spermidine synthase
VEPIVYQDEDRLTLQFQIGEIQSEMLAHNPNFLVLSYTRTMMAFLLFHSDPRRIAMIGLGGGSMPKWCYRQLPSADITVIEINPKVIALRDEFHIPPDDYRFRVICEDGADYVARTSELTEVLLVDGIRYSWAAAPALLAGVLRSLPSRTCPRRPAGGESLRARRQTIHRTNPKKF